ncbi:Uncharacterised protein [Achromobacter xylosoxidans]|nr:Uncharacterised protein [Achromobacter xylosoxidans]
MRAPTRPATSSSAPSATKLRRVALAAICPPVANASAPPWNWMSPPLTISMRDWSRRSDRRDRLSKTPKAARWRSRSCSADSLIKALRWLSSALLPSSSISTAVTDCAPSTMLPCVSAAELSRWMVPRVRVVVVASATPSWRTSRPASVTSPSAAVIRPVLRTRPPVAPWRGAISLPRVVDRVLSWVPTPRRMTKLSPAASCAWPRGVVMAPALWTSLPASST